MNKVEFLADQLQRAYSGEAWHGPSLQELLRGITFEQAAAKPIPNAHSVWELVIHIGVWMAAARRRMAGDPAEITTEQDWPAVASASEAAWQQVLTALDREQNQLRDAIRALPEETLRKHVNGHPYSISFMLNGVIQHNLYHAGQIAVLKKALTGSMASNQAAS